MKRQSKLVVELAEIKEHGIPLFVCQVERLLKLRQKFQRIKESGEKCEKKRGTRQDKEPSNIHLFLVTTMYIHTYTYT